MSQFLSSGVLTWLSVWGEAQLMPLPQSGVCLAVCTASSRAAADGTCFEPGQQHHVGYHVREDVDGRHQH